MNACKCPRASTSITSAPGAASEESFLVEFMCTPSDDASAFLSYELLDSCKYQPGEKWEMSLDELRECKDPLHLGGDIARAKGVSNPLGARSDRTYQTGRRDVDKTARRPR
jgi:hypothetical protein